MKLWHKILLWISSMAVLILFILTLVFHHEWQEGYTANEWLYAGLEQCEIEYEEVRFIKSKYENEEAITYSYELYYLEATRTNSIGDIDLWVCEETKYMVYITFELNKSFWNKFSRMTCGKELLRFTTCLDFDIAIIE